MVKVALDNPEHDEPEHDEPKHDETAGPVAKPKRRSAPPKKSRWLLKLIVLIVVLVVAGPSLISFTGLAPVILKKVHPGLGEAVSFRSATIHWWTVVELTRVRIRDLSLVDSKNPAASPPMLCEVERATTVEPLWRIVLNAGRGTGIVVSKPQLTLISDEHGTNVERTLTAVFGESTSESHSPRFPIRVMIEDGTIELRSGAVSLRDPAFSSADGNNEDAKESESTAMSASVSATVSSINGVFSTMDTERWLPEMKLTAAISRQTSGDITKATRGEKTVARPTRLAAGLDDIVSDFPDVPLDELIGINESDDTTTAKIQVILKPRADEKGRQTIQVGVRDVDLRLIRPLLSMLGLDVSCEGVVSGGIDARLAGASLAEGLVARLKLQGDEIQVRQLSWANDEWLRFGQVDAGGAFAMADDGILIQDLNFHSDLVELTGAGEMRHGSVSRIAKTASGQQLEIKGSIDLALLASSLRQTLAIHDDVVIQRGRVTFGVRASVQSAEEMAAMEIPQQPVLARAGDLTDNTTAFIPVSMTAVGSEQGTWQLVVKSEDFAAVRGGKSISIDSAIRLDADGRFADGLPELSTVRLSANFGTIDCAPDNSAWKISGLVQPATLWEQLQQLVDVPQPRLRGDVSFQSRVAMQGETIQLTDLQLNSSDVKVSSIALGITPSNPLTSMLDGTVHVEGTGAALRTLMTPWYDASWLSERSAVVSDLTATPSREIQLAIRISPESVATVRRSNVRSVSRTTGRSATAVRSTKVNSSFVIDEADVNLSMLAQNAGKRFDIQQGSVKIPGLTALVTGTVSVPETDLLLDLSADTTYDLDVLSRRLFAADSGIQFAGQGRDTFRLTGSPSALSGTTNRPRKSRASVSDLLKGSGEIKWSAANIWGLQAGPATVQANLENNLLRSAPIQCSLSGGELNIVPQYDLAKSRLQLGTGSRVQNLRVTPELCRTWLGYVAPMLADAAEVNGEISARVERFTWDFEVPENSDVVAALTIHRAEAAPGSSLTSLLEVLDLLRQRGDSSGLAVRSLLLPEQTIPIQVRRGYVAHDGLVMELSGYRMKTAGVVGLNKQLQMTIDVPLEKSSVAGNGRSITVPLRGTISQPVPDTGALLQNLGTQKIREKIGGEVDKTLNKQLNKLFDKF